MSDVDPPRAGGCRCGRVRFELAGDALITMACHCTGCQRMTGGPFSLSVAMPSDGFRVTSGEPVIGGLHGPTRHYFCGYCMSWLFTRPEAYDALVNVRTTMLDDPSAFPPYVETMTSEKLPWATTPAVHSFEKFPPLDRYQGLAAEYAAHVREAGAGAR